MGIGEAIVIAALIIVFGPVLFLFGASALFGIFAGVLIGGAKILDKIGVSRWLMNRRFKKRQALLNRR